jgi:8-oxo-dGTP diphosphatase
VAVIVGVGVVVAEEGRVLLGRRSSGAWSGTWSLPGGKLEQGESLADCARRELEEETGLLAQKDIVPFSVSTEIDMARDFHSITFGACAREVAGDVENREPRKFSEWRWFELDKLPEELFRPTSSVLNAFWEWSDLSLPGRPRLISEPGEVLRILKEYDRE